MARVGFPAVVEKGALSVGGTQHCWIGVLYSRRLLGNGILMSLPPDYVADLLLRIAPLCQTFGTIPFSDLEIIIGKAARVAHVALAAKPFVAGLWGEAPFLRSRTVEVGHPVPPLLLLCLVASRPLSGR